MGPFSFIMLVVNVLTNDSSFKLDHRALIENYNHSRPPNWSQLPKILFNSRFNSGC